MLWQVPNFTNPMLNCVAQGDMSILEEEHDFTLTEYAKYKYWNALSVASTKGYLNLVNCLLEIDAVRAHAAAEDNFALVWAVMNGHLKVVNRLLEIPVVRTNATALDNLALRLAAGDGHLDVVNRFLEIDEVRASAAAHYNGALMEAARYGHLDVVNCLLEIDEVRVNAAAYYNQALGGAAGDGHLDVVNRLLEIDEVRANAADKLGLAASNGHLKVVNRLLEMPVVRTHATAQDNLALRLAASHGHSQVAHALAKAQWPLGKQDMPEGMHRYLPMIKAGAQLYAAKREQERILISALQNKPVWSTNGLYEKRSYAALSLGYDFGANRLFTLPGDVVDSIANYAGYEAGYEGQYLAEQIRKDDWQNAWNDMRRSERLYGLFTEINRRATRALRL